MQGPLERLEMEQLFRNAADELSPQQRAVFVLKDLEGRETGEIADTLGTSEVTIRSHLHTARKRIKTVLEEQYPGLIDLYLER